MACAPSEDSDQPGHPPSLIRVFAVRMKKAWVLYIYSFSARRRLWSEWADAGPTVILLVLSWGGSYLNNYCSDLKSVFSTQFRNEWRNLSCKTNFEMFGINRVFWQKITNFWNFSKPLFYPFCNKLALKKNMVTVNVQPLSPPILFLVTTNFRANHVLTHVLKKCKEKNIDGNSKINALINAELGCAINMIIRLPVESWCDLEKGYP